MSAWSSTEQAYPPPPPPPPTAPYWDPGSNQPPPYGYTATPGPQLANYGTRLGAWLIDWVIVLVVDIPLLLVTHSLHHTHSLVLTNGSASTQSGISVSPGGFLLNALLVIGYGTLLCGGRRGQTVGMRALGIKVIDERIGSPIGLARGLGRAAFEYVMALLLVVPWIIDMLFPIWDPKNQTLHDKVTKAVVVVV